MSFLTALQSCTHPLADRRSVLDATRGKPLLVCLNCGLYQEGIWAGRADAPAPSAPPSAAPSAPAAAPAPAGPRIIRALGDIPPFVGPDLTNYSLKSGDVATVPGTIAELLVRRGKAQLVEATA